MQLFANITSAETFLAVADDSELTLLWLKAELSAGTDLTTQPFLPGFTPAQSPTRKRRRDEDAGSDADK